MNATKLFVELKRTDLYKSWIGTEKVLDTKCDKFGTIRIITKDEDDECYSLFRFFKIGDEWQVSADVNVLTVEDVAKCLLKQLNEEIK